MSAPRPMRILLAGGGTGGHVFPLVALAEAFGRLAPAVELRFVGTEQGLEARVVRERGWTLDTLPIEPIKGRSLFGAVRGGAVAAAATARATALVASHRPKLVVSIGGYAAGPVSLAAAAMGIPVALLEPNRVAGLTQKLLVPVSRRVYVGFAESLTKLGDKGRALGIPLRGGFAPVPLGVREQVHILIMGGSQGAEHLNRTLPAVMARVAKDAPIRVLHQAGRGRAEDVRAAYEGVAGAEVSEFIVDVPKALADADLVVARSGALTCAELCAVGRPSILVPYPFAADDHQAHNAEAMQAAGAAIALRQENATADALCDAIGALVTDSTRRRSMADAARARGVPDAADVIAKDLLSLAKLAISAPIAPIASGGAA